MMRAWDILNDAVLLNIIPTKGKQKEGYDFDSACLMVCKFVHLFPRSSANEWILKRLELRVT